MTFDQTLFVWCIAVPAIVAVAAALAAWRSGPRREGIVLALGWWVAIAAAMAGCNQWQWWPDDSWRRAIWPILAWAAWMPFTAVDDSEQASRWVLAGTLASLTALIAMPGGEQWSDTFHLHRVWMCGVATSCLLNSFSLQQMARRGADRWCLLVALAGLGGPLALAASTYGSLAQWTLAVIVATLFTALLGVILKSKQAWMTAYPVFAATAGITASGRFYCYEAHPAWVYLLMLYGPTLVAIIDSAASDRSPWLRITTSGLTSIAIVGSCVWGVLR